MPLRGTSVETGALSGNAESLRGATRGGSHRERLAQRLVLLHRLQPGALGWQPGPRLLVERARALPQRADVAVDGAAVGFEQPGNFLPLLGGGKLHG